MKMIREPRRASRRSTANSPIGLLRREHGGRLVEDQDAGVAVERLEDLDPLLSRRRKAATRGASGRHVEAALGHEPVELPCAPRVSVSREPSSRSVPSTMFSSTVRLSASAKCWCTMPMPAASAAAGEPGGERPETRRRARQLRSSPRRRRSGRTGCSSASSCRRRSRRAAPGSRRGEVEVDGVVGDERAEALGDACNGQNEQEETAWVLALAATGLPVVGRSARLRFGVVDVDAEQPVDDLLLLLLDGCDHVGGHRASRPAAGSRRRASCSCTGRSPRPRSCPPSTALMARSIVGSMCQSALASTVPGYCAGGVDDVADDLDVALLGGVRDAEALGIHHVGAAIDHREGGLLGLRRVVPGVDEGHEELDVRVDRLARRP